MPKMKYYAVAVGKDAPKIYDNWAECSASVSRYPHALHRSFKTQQEAERWLASKSAMTTLYARPSASKSKSDNTVIPECHQSEPKVTLSPEQSKILARVKEGKNVFFTGSAGTGKSVLLREIIRLRGDSLSGRVAITASTGIAALNIGGVTLHSWAGIKLGKEPVEQFVGKVRKQAMFEPLRERWREVTTLIVDEISMIDGTLFDYLEQIARELRKSTKPFGGIQLVLCGDFCQLPPVPGKDDKGRESPATFAFEARTWSSCIGSPMMLTKVFRQKDQTFANMLNEMRYGQMKESTIQIFRSLSRNVTYTDGIVPTEIYPTRREVANANDWRLRQLSGEARTYEAQDWPGVDHKGRAISREMMLNELERLVAPKSLELRIGAQVMLIKNLRQGVLVNGSIGQVIRFETPREAQASNTEIAKVEREEDKKNQVKSNNDGVTEILKYEWKWPVVKFTNGEILVVTPADFTINNGDGETVRAKSVHKSQGQTLDRVRVDLRRTFEKGQAYVALSRATNMEHLQVLNFLPEKVMAHPKVLTWYGKNSNAPEDFDEDDLLAFDEYHH